MHLPENINEKVKKDTSRHHAFSMVPQVTHKSRLTKFRTMQALHIAILVFSLVTTPVTAFSVTRFDTLTVKTSVAARSRDALLINTKQSTQLGAFLRKENGIPKVVSIKGREELNDFLKDDERLCIIKFYASWCKSCSKFGLKFNQLARNHGDVIDKKGHVVKEGEMRFAEIEYGQNIELCKAIGIKKLPFVQLYKTSTGKIDEFVCGPSDFKKKVTSKVELMLAMSDEELAFEKIMKEGQSLTDGIIASSSDEVTKRRSQKSI